MVFTVITNPAFGVNTGFTQGQFKKLDDLYCKAASAKVLGYRTVECDFEEGIARYTYYKSQSHAPAFQFVITKVGPKDMMYEVFKEKAGRIVKSGVFETAFLRLKEEIENLLVSP